MNLGLEELSFLFCCSLLVLKLHESQFPDL